MFCKEIQEQTEPVSAFLEYWRHNFCSGPTIVTPWCIRCVYRSAQKNSGYVTDFIPFSCVPIVEFEHTTVLWHGEPQCGFGNVQNEDSKNRSIFEENASR